MSCIMCIAAENEGYKYYYRWKNANVLVVGCRGHVKEIFDVLNNYQKDNKKVE